MNNRLKTALAAVCLCAVMTGCGTSDQSSKNGESSAVSQTTTTTTTIATNSQVSEKETVTSEKDQTNTSKPDKVPLNDSNLAQLVENVEKKYGIDIVYGNDIRTRFTEDDEDLIAQKYTKAAGIKNALKSIDEALSVFPQGLLKQLTSADGSPMKIYLTGAVSKAGDTPEPGGIPAFTSYKDKETFLTVDISFGDDVNFMTICHEVTHIIDFTVHKKGAFDDKKWDTLNPVGFTYTEDYEHYRNSDVAVKYSYTNERFVPRVPIDGQTDNDIYFYYHYSIVNAYEDRATIMEDLIIYLMGNYEVAPGLYSYPHIHEKAKYFLDCISNAFKLDNDSFKKWQDTLEELSVKSADGK